MAAIDFPASPSVGQVFTANNSTWRWDGLSWTAYDPTSGNLIFSEGTLDAGVVSTGSGGANVTKVLPNSLPSPYTPQGMAVVSNGYAWEAKPVGFSNMVVLTSSNASYPIPATKIKVTVVAAGGGSGGGLESCGVASSAGGGGGGAAIKILSGLTIGKTLNITVGTGGTAGAATPTAGGTGGTSSVASGTQTISTVSATGGGGSVGVTGSQQTAGGLGGLGAGGDLNIKGSGGNRSVGGSSPGNGGSSFFGGSTGGAVDGTNAAGNGIPGAFYGGGAGGCSCNAGSSAGGIGGAGVVIVEF